MTQLRTRTPIDMLALDLAYGWHPLAGLPGLEVKTLADDYWEEAFVLFGDLQPVSAPGSAPPAPWYSLRPPGTPHGPFMSAQGCVLLKIQYFTA